MNRLECGIDTSIDIRREALGRSENISALESLSLSEIFNEELKISGRESGVADGAYFFFVGQHSDRSIARVRAVEAAMSAGYAQTLSSGP